MKLMRNVFLTLSLLVSVASLSADGVGANVNPDSASTEVKTASTDATAEVKPGFFSTIKNGGVYVLGLPAVVVSALANKCYVVTGVEKIAALNCLKVENGSGKISTFLTDYKKGLSNAVVVAVVAGVSYVVWAKYQALQALKEEAAMEEEVNKARKFKNDDDLFAFDAE